VGDLTFPPGRYPLYGQLAQVVP